LPDHASVERAETHAGDSVDDVAGTRLRDSGHDQRAMDGHQDLVSRALACIVPYRSV
jgi:hypothetical protein